MEVDASNTKPISAKHILYQQIQDKSETCDVIVNHGKWEMAFHWCILIASPFFENIYKNDFVEKQTGKVSLQIGTHSVVESCLLFLYGKKPKFRDDNISGFLEVAEFFMIPSLKAMCITWLQRKHVTENNCYNFLESSSIYEFEMPKCTEFIRGNLPEMLQKNEMLNMTHESVQYILSDPTHCYVNIEEKYIFLVRWIKAIPERCRYFAELFQLLDLSDMSIAFIETIVKTEALVNVYCKDILLPANINDGMNDYHTVLIPDCSSATSQVLDLHRKQWYKLQLTEKKVFFNEKIAGGNAVCDSDVYTIQSFKTFTRLGINTKSSQILINNLSDNTFIKTTIEVHGDPNIHQSELFKHINNRSCIVVHSTTEQIKATYLKPSSRAASSRFRSKQRFLNVLTIYIGVVKEGTTTLYPRVAIPGRNITQYCVSKSKVIAMLTIDRDSLILYDENVAGIDELFLRTNYDFKTEKGDILTATSSGFVIYNDTRVFCVTQSSDPASPSKYNTFTRNLENNKLKTIKYSLYNDQWFRYIPSSRDPKPLQPALAYTSHNDVVTTEEGSEVTWINLPIPDDKFTLEPNLFTLRLPKRLLICHIKCPHCEQKSHSPSRYYEPPEEDFGVVEWCQDSYSDYDYNDDDNFDDYYDYDTYGYYGHGNDFQSYNDDY